jgi:hypothetical protein
VLAPTFVVNETLTRARPASVVLSTLDVLNATLVSTARRGARAPRCSRAAVLARTRCSRAAVLARTRCSRASAEAPPQPDPSFDAPFGTRHHAAQRRPAAIRLRR